MITIDSRLHAIGMKAAAALIEGVTNSPSDATLTTAINKRVEALRGKFPPDGPRAWREVSSLQGVYRQIGASWRNNRPSIERLGMMIAKGRNLPSINSVVDIYNIASLENRMCMGAHDADVLKMPVSLRETLGSEEFVPLGGETERVPASEFAYFDNAGRIICRTRRRASRLLESRSSQPARPPYSRGFSDLWRKRCLRGSRSYSF